MCLSCDLSHSSVVASYYLAWNSKKCKDEEEPNNDLQENDDDDFTDFCYDENSDDSSLSCCEKAETTLEDCWVMEGDQGEEEGEANSP